MSFEWGDYVRLAEHLLELGSDLDEARLRSAISRAYYGAFHHAAGFVLLHHPDFAMLKKGDDHKRVITELRRWQGPGKRRPVKQAGRDLGELLHQRRMADYDERVPGLKEVAIRSVKTAAQVLKNLPLESA